MLKHTRLLRKSVGIQNPLKDVDESRTSSDVDNSGYSYSFLDASKVEDANQGTTVVYIVCTTDLG